MKRNNGNTPTLDLHGTKHKDVFRRVDKFIGEHLLKGTTNQIFIITGHSKEMKNLVNKALMDYELYSQESIINNGLVVVDLT